MTDEAQELKPCPFCGGRAEIERYGTSRVSTLYECWECGCKLETGETFNHGERWNQRNDGWISVETPPEIDGQYLVVINNKVDVINKVSVARFYGGSFVDSMGLPPVTHYRPFPQPPQDK